MRLCGNHELFLLQEYYGYVTYDNPQAIASDLKEAIIRGDAVASYTDGERLYTHAGMMATIKEAIIDTGKEQGAASEYSIIDLGLFSDKINTIFRDAVEKSDVESHPIFHADRGRGGRDPVSGIFWCDFNSLSHSEEAYLVKQVVGHNPIRKACVATARGMSLINVDAGMCKKYGGERVFLEIIPDGLYLEHSKTPSGWVTTPLDGN